MTGIHGSRVVGHIRPPTPEQVMRYAAAWRLAISPDEVADGVARVAEALALFDRLDELAEPWVPLRHPYRDSGWVPTELEDPLNAVIRFCEVRGAESGPLAGMRVGVKDCIAVAGVPMTAGGRRTPVAVPAEDAVAVERLLDAGATIVAKTNMADMALGLGEASAFGATRNPHNPRFSAGGSSSGSAAAVASGLVDTALGSDQAGSIRVPSAWCGIVGMKATHGLVPTHGLTYVDHTVDYIGPMTRTVAENAAMLATIAGGDWRDPQWVRADPVAGDYPGAAGRGIGGLRIGVVTESVEPAGCTARVTAAFERAQKVLADLGADLVPVSVPLWSDASAIWTGVVWFGWAAMLNSFGQGHGHLGRVDVNLLATIAAQCRLGARDLPEGVRTMLLTVEHLREAYQAVHFGRAQNLRLELCRQVERVLAEVDLLITPTTPTGPFVLPEERQGGDALLEALARTNVAVNTSPLDLTGHPALTVPSGPGDDDLPTGLQIVGRLFDEQTVYRAGFAFEAEPASREIV